MAGDGVLILDSITKADVVGVMFESEGGKQKWQLSSLAMYGDPDDPRFSLIAHYPLVRPWTVEFDVTGQLDNLARQIGQADAGFYPTIVTGTGASDFARQDFYRLTVVYEKFSPNEPFSAAMAAPALTVYESWEEMAAGAYSASSMVVSFDTFGTVRSAGTIGGDPFGEVYLERCVALRYNQVQQFWLPWSVQRLDDVPKHDPAGVQRSMKNDAVMKNWARIDHAVPSRWSFSGADSTIVTYRKDMYEPWPDLQADFAPGKRVVGPVKGFDELEYHRSIWVNDYGYWPHRIGANGSGGSPRLCCTFVPWGKRKPKTRYFFVIDATDANPPEFVNLSVQAHGFGRGTATMESSPNAEVSPGGGFSPMRWAPSMFSGAPRMRANLVFKDGAPRLDVKQPVLAGLDVFLAHGGGGGRQPGQPGDPPVVFEPSGGGISFTPGTMEISPVPTMNALLAQIDQRVRVEMEWRHSRHAQLVISVDGRCKLARAYTYGELGYPCTQLHHKMGLKSVSKWLTAMAVVHFFTDPDLSIPEMRQQLRNVKLPQAFGLSSAVVNAKPWKQKLMDTNLEDLLSHRSGWSYDFWGRVKQLKGTKRAEPGDMRDCFELTPEDPYATPPGGPGVYNNYHSLALAEIVAAYVMPPSFGSYHQVLRNYWQDNQNLYTDSLPQSVADAFDKGGSPAHSYYPGWKEEWLTETTPFLNAPVYYAENEYWLGTDMFMTVPMLARILDGHLENPPHPVKPLLKPKQLLLMGMGPSDDPSLLLGVDGADSIDLGRTSANNPDWKMYLRLFKNGGEDGATSFAAMYWRLSPDGGGPQLVTIAFAQDGARDAMGPSSADLILAPVQWLVDEGYWDPGLNLYGSLF